jgi:hypothetical protein
LSEKQTNKHFVVSYRDPVEQKTISIKVRKVDDSPLGLSFIRISDFVFDTSSLVVNPDEENLKKRLENTRSLHLSIYTILSIEEIGLDQPGLRFKTDKSNLVVLPTAEKPTPHNDS